MPDSYDLLPSYQLHELLSRSIPEVVADLKLADQSKPTYFPSSSTSTSTSTMASNFNLNDNYSNENFPNNSNEFNIQDHIINRYHAENNYKESLLSHFYDLRYKIQDAIDIFISIDDVGELNNKKFTTSDHVKGFFRIYNKSNNNVDLGLLLVTLEGNFWWKVRRNNSTKLITKPLLTMVDIEASKLNNPNIIKPGDYKQYPFNFLIPDLDYDDKPLPPSFGDLHYFRSFSSEMFDTMNFEKEPKDYFRISNQFSISYCINVRSIILNSDGNDLEIRKHTRHIINFNPINQSSLPIMNDNNLDFSLTPNQELEILIECYEKRLKLFHPDNSSPSTSTSSTTTTNNNFNNSNINVETSFDYHQIKENTIKNSIKLQNYNPNEVPDEELRNKLRPNAYDNPGIRLFHLDKRKKNGSFDPGPSIPFDYRLLSSPILSSKRSFTILINTEFKLKKIELYSLNTFSTVKLPCKLSPSWFINEPNESLYSQVIQPKVKKLLTKFKENPIFQNSSSTIDIESQLPIKDLLSLSYLCSQLDKTCISLKFKKSKQYHSDNIFEISLESNKNYVNLTKPFKTDFSELFYFIRFSFKLPRGMFYKDQEFAYFDVPIELNS